MDQQMEENIHENNGTFLKKKNITQICSNQIDFWYFSGTVVMQEISKNGQTNKAFDEKIN